MATRNQTVLKISFDRDDGTYTKADSVFRFRRITKDLCTPTNVQGIINVLRKFSYDYSSSNETLFKFQNGNSRKVTECAIEETRVRKLV